MKNSRVNPPAMRSCWQRTLRETYGLSLSIKEMASAKALVRGLPHLGSSYSAVLILPSAKRLRHFFSGERIMCAVLSCGLESAVMLMSFRTVLYSMNLLR
jgi:hypothetical protein